MCLIPYQYKEVTKRVCLICVFHRSIRVGTRTRKPIRVIKTRNSRAIITTRRMAMRKSTRKRVVTTRSIKKARKARNRRNSTRRVSIKRVTIPKDNTPCTKR